MDESPIEEQRRYEAVVARALEIFGKRPVVASWMAQFNPAIAGGAEPVSTACRTQAGFVDAMMELDRIARRGPAGVTPPPRVEMARPSKEP